MKFGLLNILKYTKKSHNMRVLDQLFIENLIKKPSFFDLQKGKNDLKTASF